MVKEAGAVPPGGLLWPPISLILIHLRLKMYVLGWIVVIAPSTLLSYSQDIHFHFPTMFDPHAFSYSVSCVAEFCHFISQHYFAGYYLFTWCLSRVPFLPVIPDSH